MSDIKKLLSQYAAESERPYIEGGDPVELLTGVDDIHSELSDKSEQLLSVADEVVETSIAVESLVHFVSSYSKRFDESEWDRSSAITFESGINSILEDAGIPQDLYSFESGAENIGVSQTSKENRKGAISKAIEAVMKFIRAVKIAIKKGWTALKEFLFGASRSIKWMKKSVPTLRDKMQDGISNGRVKTGKIEKTPKWAGYLYVGGQKLSPDDALKKSYESYEAVVGAVGDSFVATLMRLKQRGMLTGYKVYDHRAAKEIKTGDYPVGFNKVLKLSMTDDSLASVSVTIDKTSEPGSDIEYIPQILFSRFLDEYESFVNGVVKMYQKMLDSANSVRDADFEVKDGETKEFTDENVENIRYGGKSLTRMFNAYSKVATAALRDSLTIAKSAYSHGLASAGA